jgi:uncharacterized protein
LLIDGIKSSVALNMRKTGLAATWHALMGGMAAPAFAIDCQKASTRVDKMICRDAALSAA